MSPFLSMCVLVFPFMYAQNYRMNTICFAWYELYYQKFYRSVTFCPANMCPFTRLMFTSLFTLEPPDLLIPMAIEQDGDQTFCKTPGPVEQGPTHSRMNEWCNFSNEKRGWSMYDQIDSNCIYWLHTPSTYEYVRNPYAFMMLENAKLHLHCSSCFFLDYINANC